MSQYINCESEVKPHKIGFYSVHIQNVRTAFPEYLEFDGKSWGGLESIKEIFGSNGVFWSEGEDPLNSKPVMPKLF